MPCIIFHYVWIVHFVGKKKAECWVIFQGQRNDKRTMRPMQIIKLDEYQEWPKRLLPLLLSTASVGKCKV